VGEPLLDVGDVVDSAGVVPAAAEPLADAAPQIAGLVATAQPLDVALEAGPPPRVRVVHVEGGVVLHHRPAVLRGVPLDLEEPVALVAALAVEGAGRAQTRVRGVVAEAAAFLAAVLVPAALLRGLGPDHVFLEAPLARGPLDDLVGGAGEVAGDAAA